jgi:ornithine cyclodeaminase
MGSDAKPKNELDRAMFRNAVLYVADSLVQTRRLGELHHAIDSGLIAPEAVFSELGEIVAGRKAGRQTAESVTICDLTGTGVQDTAIAVFAFNRARQAEAGLAFDTNQALRR